MTAPSQPSDQSPQAPVRVDDRGLPPEYQLKAGWEVSPRQTQKELAGPAEVTGHLPLLLDCRRPDEWEFTRIDGAVHFPMDLIPTRIDDVLEAAGGHDRPIIVYCHHGMRSLRVTSTLRGYGFTNVRSMAGGIEQWSLAINPNVPRY